MRLVAPALISLAVTASARAEPANAKPPAPWGGLPEVDTLAAEPAPAFQGLRFLLGDWTGTGSGASGASSGGFTLTSELSGQVLIRRNEAVSQSRGSESGQTRHSDLMIVYPESGTLKAVYFDNEGHTIHYVVTTSEGHATFESEEHPNSPRFKLDYALQADGQLGITFAIAPPGKPYRPYLTGTVRRREVKSDPPSISASAAVATGMTAEYKVTATNGGTIEPPAFGELTVLKSQKSAQTSLRFVNGVKTRNETTIITWTLSAPHDGHFTIGPARLVLKQQTLQSNPVDVTWSTGAPPASSPR